MDKFKIPSLKLGLNVVEQQQDTLQTPGSATSATTDDDMSDEDRILTNKTTVPALKLNFSMPSSQNDALSTSRSNTSAASTPMSSQRSASSLGSPNNHHTAAIKVPTLNLVKGTTLADKLALQRSPQRSPEPKTVQVDLLVPKFCKCTVDDTTGQADIGSKLSEQISKKWFGDSKENNFELYRLQSLSKDSDSSEQYVCKLSNAQEFNVSAMNELIAQNQALTVKVQKTMEALMEYQDQNSLLKKTIERQRGELHDALVTKQEMKNIVDSLLYQHQLLAAAMTEKQVQPTDNVKVVAPKKSKKKPIKRKQRSKKK